MTWQQRLLPRCTRILFVVNTLTVSQFLLHWMQIIFCIYKDFLRQLKAFLPSFCHLCACEMSPGWGHLITWTDPSVGHLNGILAWVGGNLNNNFQKSQMPEVARGGYWSFDLTDTLTDDFVHLDLTPPPPTPHCFNATGNVGNHRVISMVKSSKWNRNKFNYTESFFSFKHWGWSLSDVSLFLYTNASFTRII